MVNTSSTLVSGANLVHTIKNYKNMNLQKEYKYLTSLGVNIRISGFPTTVLSYVRFYNSFPNEEWKLLKNFINNCILDTRLFTKSYKDDYLIIRSILMCDSFDEFFKLRVLYQHFYDKKRKQISNSFLRNSLYKNQWYAYLSALKKDKSHLRKVPTAKLPYNIYENIADIDLVKLKRNLSKVQELTVTKFSKSYTFDFQHITIEEYKEKLQLNHIISV